MGRCALFCTFRLHKVLDEIMRVTCPTKMNTYFRTTLFAFLLIHFLTISQSQGTIDLHQFRKDSHDDRVKREASHEPFVFPGLLPQQTPLQITPGGSETFLIQDVLLGDLCLVPTNMETRPAGSPSFGTFANGLASIGIEEGVILATGDSEIALGPNTSSNDGTTGGGTAGFDADLAAISGSSALFNVTILEFDFIPDEDKIAFDYVFASEEYCEYVSTVFNDAFGFFLSGPGINGPYTDNAINIATIPGTNTPVAINNVNWTLNSSYYVTNAVNEFPGTPPGNCTAAETSQPTPLSTFIEYDGFTTNLTAEADVIPCEVYHIKIAIADIGDGIFDSAVFLGKNSFVSGDDNTRINVVSGYTDPNDETAEEGCENAYIAFEKVPPNSSVDISFVVESTSTATEGVDFANFPAIYTIPAGVQFDTLWIDIFGDLLAEGVENIDISIEGLCECINPTVQIFIEDPEPYERAVTLCEGEAYDGPSGPIFEPAEILEVVTDPNGCDSLFITQIQFNPLAYYDTLLYACFNEVIEFEGVEFTLPGDGVVLLDNQSFLGCDSIIYVTVEWINPIYPIVEPDVLTCEVDSIQLQSSNTDYSSVTFFWVGPNEFISLDYEPWVTEPGEYSLQVSQTIGDKTCQSTAVQTIIVQQDTLHPILVDIPDQELYCGASSDTIYAEIENASLIQSAQYQWIGPNGFSSTSSSIVVSDSGSYNLIVINLSNGCESVVDFQVESITDQPDVTILNSAIGCDASEAILSTTVSIEGGVYNWVGPNGFVSSDQSPTVSDTGTYQLTYFISPTCQTALTTYVGIDNSLPPISLSGDTLTCLQDSVTLIAIVDSSATSQWITPSNESIVGTEIVAIDPGIYYFFNTGNNGCIAEDSIEVLLFDNGSDFTLQAPVLNCDGNEVTISMASDDELLYQTVTPNNDTLYGLDPIIQAPGLYEITAVNDFGCESSSTISVEIDTLSPDATLDIPVISCFDSSIIVSLTNQNQEMTEMWEGPAGFTSDLDSIEIEVAGQYQVTLTAENGCQQVYDFIVEIDTLSPTFVVQNDTIECTTNMATLSAEGLLPTYEIKWYNSFDNSLLGESPELDVDNSGDYYAVVTDTINGCQLVQNVNVSNDINYPDVSLSTDTLTCIETSVDVQVETTDSDLVFDWTGPGGFTSDMSNPTVSEAGVYQVEVTNDAGCATNLQLAVYEDTESPTIALSGEELTCDQQSIVILATLEGEISDIYWTGPNNFVSNLEQPEITDAGTYSLLVTGTNGCTSSQDLLITQDKVYPQIDSEVSDTITCEVTEVQIVGNHDGPITSIASWLGPNGFSSEESSFTTNQIGIYYLEVVPPNGCTVYDTVEVYQDLETIAIQVANGHIDCNAPVFSAGNSYMGGVIQNIIWTGPNSFESNEENPQLSEAGTYDLIVTGENGCSSAASLIVTSDFETPNIELSGDSLSCENTEVEITVNSDNSELSYLWVDEEDNTYDTKTILTNSPGNYDVTVTDLNNGCTSVENIEIIELPDLLAFDWLTEDPNCLITSGTIEFMNVEGGTPPFLFSIDGGVSYSSNPIFTNVSDGVHNLQVIDSKSCNLEGETIIVAFIEEIVDDEIYIKFLGEATSFEVETSIPQDQIASISWSPSSNLSCTDCLNPNLIALQNETFIVTITDLDGCVYEAKIELRILERPIYVPNVFTPNNNGVNEYFTIFGDFEPIEIVSKFAIYDRWGNLVYKVEDKAPDDMEVRWYGDFNGQPAKQGVYAYIINYVTVNGETKTLVGDVTLMR